MKRGFVISTHGIITPDYKIDCSNYKLDFVFVISAIANNFFNTSPLHPRQHLNYKLQNFLKICRGTCAEKQKLFAVYIECTAVYLLCIVNSKFNFK